MILRQASVPAAHVVCRIRAPDDSEWPRRRLGLDQHAGQRSAAASRPRARRQERQGPWASPRPCILVAQPPRHARRQRWRRNGASRLSTMPTTGRSRSQTAPPTDHEDWRAIRAGSADTRPIRRRRDLEKCAVESRNNAFGRSRPAVEFLPPLHNDKLQGAQGLLSPTRRVRGRQGKTTAPCAWRLTLAEAWF